MTATSSEHGIRHPSRWATLILLSIAFTATLDYIHLPASRLLGPMVVAIVLAVSAQGVTIHRELFIAAQGVVGILIASSVPRSVAPMLYGHTGLLVVGVITVSALSTLLAWLLTRWSAFPGTTALWGMTPGAATAMTLLAESHGEDARLVATMQYVRVVSVSLVSACVALLWPHSTATLPAAPVSAPPSLLQPVLHWGSLATTLAIALGGAFLGARMRVPAGAMLVPLLAGISVQNGAGLALELHPLVLATSYALIGWAIGMRFDRQIVAICTGFLPRIFASTAALMALCGATGAAMTHWAGIDPLTAYLATSPGGADMIAIITSSAPVDAAFVAAMQLTRMLFVMATAPVIAVMLARYAQAPAT